MNFPTRHRLNQTEAARAAISNADVIAGLELTDFWSTVHSVRGQAQRAVGRASKPGTKLLSTTANHIYMKDN